MTWLIDLGNTRLKCAWLSVDGVREPTQAWRHRDMPVSEVVAALLGHMATSEHITRSVFLASVAPRNLTNIVVEALCAQGLSVHRVHSLAQCGRLQNAYVEPERLGVDRFLALLAASKRSDGPWLIVSVGSAVTVDILDIEGKHYGGLIAPTPDHMRESLAVRFDALDLPEGIATDFAKDSADAIASGVRAALLGLLDRSVNAAQRMLGKMPTLLVTGGGSAVLEGWEQTPIVQVPDLVLEGLAIFVRTAENWA